MNQTERRYADLLEDRKRAGEITFYAFEAVKLKLAKLTQYTPDFMVVRADGVIEFHEVKGTFWEDDARVKVKVAAEKFPFVFRAFRAERKGGFTEETFTKEEEA